MSDSQYVGGVHYDVDMNIEGLVGGGRLVQKELDKLEKNIDGTSKAIVKLDKTALAVSNSLKMPEINRLSRDMAQLSGKIGASSAATDKAMQANTKFTGVLSTVSSQMGAGYIGNVGSATASLINHTKAAIEATQVELANAEANKKQAEGYQASAAQMVINTNNQKKAVQAELEAANAALDNVHALDGANDAKQRSLESLRARQTAMLKDAEITYQMSESEENLQRVTKASNALHATETKIKTHLATTGKEVENAEARVTRAKEAEAAITAKLEAATALEQKAKATLVITDEAVTTASVKATAATQAQTIAMNGLRGVMGLLGGPTGLFLLAAAGVYALYEAMTDDTAIKEYNAKIDEMITKIDSLTSKQAEVVSRELGIRIAKTKEELAKSVDEVKKLESNLERMNNISNKNSNVLQSIKLATKQLGEYNLVVVEGTRRIREQEAQRKQLNKVEADRKGLKDERVDAMNIFNDAAKGAIESNKMLAKTIELGSPALAKMELEVSALELSLSAAGISSEEAEIQVANLKQTLEAGRTDSFELMLQGIEENVQALKIEMEEGKEAAIEYLATVQMAKAGVSDDGLLDRLISGLRKQHELQTQISNGKKKGSGGKKDKATDELKRQQIELSTLQKRFKLLSSGVGDANKEMAVFEAIQKLGEKATQGQKDAVAKEAAEIYDLTQKVNDFTRAQEATPELKLAREFGEEAKVIRRMFDEGFIDKETFTRLGREATQAFEQGMTDIKVNASVNYLEENRAKFDPIQALANEHTKKLAMMKEYQAQEEQILAQSLAKQQITQEEFNVVKAATDAQYLMLKTAADKQYQEQQIAAQWELLSQQNLGYEMLTSAVDSFAGSASNAMTGLITGTMSAADAARSLGSTILNSVVNAIVQMGIEALKNFILSQTIGTATTTASVMQAGVVATAWAPAAALASLASFGSNSLPAQAAILGTVGMSKALAVSGARYNGGSVGAGQMYRVGEHGKPEIYQASSGKQYMIPGDNGKVISNKDMQGGGGGVTVNVAFNDYSSGGHRFDAQATQDGNVVTVQAFIMDMEEKGPMLQSITRNTTASPRARG